MNQNTQISKSRKSISIICLLIIIFCITAVSINFFGTSNTKKTETVQSTDKRVNLSTPYYDSIYRIAYQAIENEPRIKLNATLKKAEVKIRLKEKIDEEKIRAMGIYYHDKYLAEPFNRVYVYLYTPDMINEDKGCYATAHSDPLHDNVELKVVIYDN